MATATKIVFDCSDPHDPPSAIADPDRTGLRIAFQQVPERKTVKNRVHLDLNIGGADSVHPRTSDAGGSMPRTTGSYSSARVDRAPCRSAAATSSHMFDPEGNEFDVH